ncbi:ABC transporter permease [Petrocella atlantisensis]|uniref:ABC transporter permease n=1 Tax=Petrocella atlantisensis TaxID=2173034 RepID=A0A3P7PXN4_9FIRM|nr:ABC transporter permease [Petrocella atlantisensis]VDN47951.1 ABC transporter permease [Petrocella atlantisensis]
MIFEWKVAIRFLKEGKGQSIFILLGISVGVAVMVFLNTLISGLQENLINQTVGNSSHVWLIGQSAFEQQISGLTDDNVVAGNADPRPVQLGNWQSMMAVLEERDDLRGISPLVEGNAFYVNNSKATPVIIKGFDPQKADAIYNISTRILEGSSNYDGNNLLVGNTFATDNELEAGDVIKLNLPSGVSQSFVISGIFDLGNSAVNNSWMVMDLSRAQKLLGYGNEVTKIEMQVKEIFDAEAIDASIESRLEGVVVDNWIESNSSLLAALQSQSASSIMIQVFVLLAVTLGISSVLAVSVVQKSKQLGILKAMGTKSGQASRIFLLQGLILGIIGSLMGAAFGIGLVQMFLWGTSLSTGVPLFPLSIQPQNIIVIAIISSLSSTIAAFVPANRSSKLNPVEVIRNG